MRSRWPATLAIMVLGVAPATARAAIADAPATACLRAATLAEQRWGLPRHLLGAIGAVESGRRDPLSGRVVPWPFTANIGGSDSAFDSAGQAMELVGWARSKGAVQVDVGCFQVSLHWHPAAFAALADGFKPRLNADYAARYLHELFVRTRSWEQAISLYHSADPSRGNDYLGRVLKAWHGTIDAPDIPVYTAATLPAGLRAALLPTSP